MYEADWQEEEVDHRSLKFQAVFSSTNERLARNIPWSDNPVTSGKSINTPNPIPSS